MAAHRLSTRPVSTRSLLSRYGSLGPSLLQALAGAPLSIDGLRLVVPGSLAIRMSVLAGNVRMRAVLDAVLRPGATVVDVGANIGVIAACAAMRVGPSGRVVAIEPAEDNLAVLRENVHRNRLEQVTVVAGAAGRRRETRDLYVRGDVSAVNSFFPESCYGSVTSVTHVPVAPVDDLVSGEVALVKIDVEGAELDVLAGMPRLLAQPATRLIVEWHPALQRAAGYEADALPRALLDAGFLVHAVGHLRVRPLLAADVAHLTVHLLRAQRPVELFCVRPAADRRQ